MSIRKAIYDLLNDTEADMYALAAEQETTDPYGVYSIRIEYVRTQDGATVKEASVSLNIYGSDFATAITLADSMRGAVENASGTYDTETLMVGLFQSEGDNYVPELDKYVLNQDYLLKFE